MSTNKKKPEGASGGGEDCHSYAAHRAREACLPMQNVTHPLRYYEFTQEEIKALEECDRESFYRRCLPLSGALAAAALATVRTGLVMGNAHFGAVPKVLLGAALGHALGRLSYLRECDRRLRRLPASSHLGNVMRNYHYQKHPTPVLTIPMPK